MSLDVQKQHEIVFLLLYNACYTDSPLSSDLLQLVGDECKISSLHMKNACEKTKAILPHLSTIDAYIKNSLENYTPDRLFTTDRTILRLALYELLIEKQLDNPIIIAEAKRLAKKFSTEESPQFIHAFLHKSLLQSE